jgi:hypothetical protein
VWCQVPPETRYSTEAIFRQNKITKRSGVKEVYFGKISPKFRRMELVLSPKVMDLQQVHADVHFKDMQHGHAALTWACSTDIRQGNAVTTCSMEIQQLHASFTCCTNMQQGEAAECSLYMRHFHATWTCSKDMQ